MYNSADTGGHKWEVNGTQTMQIMQTGFIGPQPGVSCFQGTYVYKHQNQGSNYDHKIRGPKGGYIDTEMNTNSVAYIKVQTTGTGIDDAFCEYTWSQDGENLGATLTHIRGNSGGSSNRPYMTLDGQHPCWRTAHNTGYTYIVRVEITGGEQDLCYPTHTAYSTN